MLQSIRNNAQGIVAKILVGLIAFTFVIWGAESLFISSGAEEPPVSVNGEEISVETWRREAALQRRQLLENNPNIDPVNINNNIIEANALDTLIQQAILLQYIDAQDMTVSPAFIDKTILETPDFQIDGTFNQQRFQTLLANAGLTLISFKARLARNHLVQQLQTGIQTSAFVLPSQVKLAANLDQQKRSYTVASLSLKDELAKTTVSDATVENYYQNNLDKYTLPAEVKVAYVMLDKQNFIDQINISDTQLRDAYETAKNQHKATNERNASHILFEVNEEQTEVQALELAAKAIKKLQSGQTFAQVAQEVSQDVSTKDEGGDLGPIEPGEFEGVFEDTLYALEEGDYSDPIITAFGVQIIKYNASAANAFPSFEDESPNLKVTLQSQEAEALFVDASEILADLAFSSADLREINQELNLEIQESDWFTIQGLSDFGEQSQRVADIAFSDEILVQEENSEVIELGSNQIMVLRKQDYREPELQSFQQVQQQISTSLVREKAEDLVKVKAESFLARLKNAQDVSEINAIKQEISDNWAVHQNADRNDDTVNRLVTQTVFSLPRPIVDVTSFGTVPAINGDVYIIEVTDVINPEPQELALSERQEELMTSILTNLYGQAEMSSLQKELRSKADIERLTP